MRHKTKRKDYKNRHQFLDDVTLMRRNAEIFNGEEHYISRLARQLEDIASGEIDCRQDEIVNLEGLVLETQ